jgi:hypothetical protein
MEKKMTIREFIEKFEAGVFDKPDVSTQCDAGWHDWFCRPTSLVNKTKRLGKLVIQLSKSPKVDIDKMYVFFKNNCPVGGHLYDSFSFCDIEDSRVVWWVAPRLGYNIDSLRGMAQVFDAEKGEDVVTGTWKDVKNFFLK